MNTLSTAVLSRKRLVLLFLIGIMAGFAESAYYLPDGIDASGSYIARILFASILGAGLALDAGVPVARLSYALIWCCAGAFGDVLFSPSSALIGRICLGAGLGGAVAAPGPLHPVPWVGAARGALGSCVAGLAIHVAARHGAPEFLLSGIEAIIIGQFLAHGRAQRMLSALSGDLDTIRSRGSAEQRNRAEGIINLAIQAAEEIDSSEESSGEDRSESRAEVTRIARRALGLLRRLAVISTVGADLREHLASCITRDEEHLERIYRTELTRTLGTMTGAI
mgnify:CR=1 FL=1